MSSLSKIFEHFRLRWLMFRIQQNISKSGTVEGDCDGECGDEQYLKRHGLLKAEPVNSFYISHKTIREGNGWKETEFHLTPEVQKALTLSSPLPTGGQINKKNKV